MNIVSMNDSHDGQIVYIKDGKLIFSIESEKDSWPRYEKVTPFHYLNATRYIERVPDVIALTGRHKSKPRSKANQIGAGYLGISGAAAKITEERILMGDKVKIFSSTHERSHIFCSYGLSHFPQGEPCYVPNGRAVKY